MALYHSLFFFLVFRWLKEQRKLNIFVEPRVKSELLMESSFYNFVQTWKDGELVKLIYILLSIVYMHNSITMYLLIYYYVFINMLFSHFMFSSTHYKVVSFCCHIL